MSTAPTKRIKSALRLSLKDGFHDRGWLPLKGRSTTFIAPSSLVDAPLTLECDVDIDSDTYGGARFTAYPSIRSHEVTDLLVGFDWAGLPSARTRFGEEGLRLSLYCAFETAGGLVNPLRNYHRWVVRAEEDLEVAVTDFFVMVDGPLEEWARELRTVRLLLDSVATADPDWRLNSVSVRTLSALALAHHDPETARQLLATYQPPGGGEEADRLALFERELVDRFPVYGPLQKQP